MDSRLSISAGRASPLGATPDEGGVNFAVFSTHATRMVLCLYDGDGRETRIDLPEREGDVWHGHVAGLKTGQLYGFRAYGPYRPDEGHRFNPNKLLMDPYARQLTGHPTWNDALYGYSPGHTLGDLSFDPRDSAPFMPRSVVTSAHWPHDPRRPNRQSSETVIYEAHLKGLTQLHPEIPNPGTYSAAASDPILDHLTRLGVTAIEFLPIQAFINDRFLVEKGLTNYWGYQPWGYFAPDPRYLSASDIFEVRRMVDRFHGAGIEVIMDVVYNHTGEGGHFGPTLSFRGLDNVSYYRLAPDNRRYIDDTGTGNTLRCDHPMVLRMILDSLRYWVQGMGVDGFRFDLATTLGRTGDGSFDRDAPLLMAMRQDPILSRVKLIAEPWDIGPGGYQLGAFTAPFLSWNDKFRDGVRRFWRGDPGRAGDLAARISGSAMQFDHSGRRATSSVNFLTAHDGFTLEDVVSYRQRHNDANGEQGRDGHGENFSDNFGVEGPCEEPIIRAARDRRKRNMIATLLMSQGTPMILAGDELGNSQRGNNNAYNQDNETAWIDWRRADPVFHRFVRRMIAFRRDHPVLRQSRFLHSMERALDGLDDIFWRRPDGAPMQAADWDDPQTRCICVELRTASGTPHYAALEYAVFAVLNAGGATAVSVPDPPPGSVWSKRIDTAEPDSPAAPCADGPVTVAADSVAIFTLDPAD